jgi:hypothetical protein
VSEQPKYSGPIEEHEWPDKLTAHVVTPGPHPRIHGYDVEGDLARHYSFSETLFLTLVGELPDQQTGAAFDTLLTLLAPIAVSEAPSHAAALVRICGAGAGGVVSVGTVALAEQSRWLVAEHRELLTWLATNSGPTPERYRTTDDREQSAAVGLRHRLADAGLDLERIDPGINPLALMIAGLYRCGISQPQQIETVLTIARLPCVVAEAFARSPGAFRTYPMQTPRFEYEEPG